MWFNLWFFIAWEMCHLKKCLSWSQNFTLHINKIDKAIQTKHSTFNVKPNDGLMKFSCMSNVVCPCEMLMQGESPWVNLVRGRDLWGLCGIIGLRVLKRPWAWILKLRNLYGLYRTVGLRDLELEFWRLEDLCGLCRTIGLYDLELESWSLMINCLGVE